MKKVLFLSIVFVTMTTSFAAVTVKAPPKKATEILIPVGTSGKLISLMELSQMSVKEYQQLTGNKLKLTGKLAFKLSQRELKSLINSDGSINNTKLEILAKKAQKAADDSRRHLRLALIFLAVAVAFGILSLFVGFLGIIAGVAALVSAVFFVLWLVNMAA